MRLALDPAPFCPSPAPDRPTEFHQATPINHAPTWPRPRRPGPTPAAPLAPPQNDHAHLATPRLPGSRSPHPSGAESGRDASHQLSADPQPPPRPWPRRDPAPYGPRSVAAAAASSCVSSSLWLVTRTRIWLRAQPGLGHGERALHSAASSGAVWPGGGGQEGTLQTSSGL